MNSQAKFVAVIAAQPGAGRSVCVASIAMSLARRGRCAAVDLDTASGSLRNLLGASRVANLDYLPLSRSNDDTETLLRVLRSSSENYAIARLPAGITGDALALFAAADAPIIVTEPSSSALDKVIEFFQECDSWQFEGRRVYMIVNRIQRGGEEKAAAAVVKKIRKDFALDLHILGTILYDPQVEVTLRTNIPLSIENLHDPIAIAFEDMAFKIERNPAATPRERKIKALPTASKRKKNDVPPGSRKLSDAIKRIDHLEGIVHAQAIELKQLQDRMASLRGSAASSNVLHRKRLSTRRYVFSVVGAGLALCAFIVTPPFIKRLGATRTPVQAAAPLQVAAPPPAPVLPEKPAVSAPAPAPSTAPPTDGAVLKQVLPDVPQAASDTIRGKVSVSIKATIDPSGKVMDAAFEVPGPSKYFAGLAIEAVRNWTFKPPRIDNKSVASEWILDFIFENDGPHAVAVQSLPKI